MGSRKGVGSLIGIGFLLIILALGFSYYNLTSRVEDRTNEVLMEAQGLDRDAADEDLDFVEVALTGGNSLNLTLKNTGTVFAELEWIGVFDDTLNTQDYYRVDTGLNPLETRKDIGNSSIVMNPINDYTIQVLTRLGNIYYAEYPFTSGGSGGGGGNGTSYYYAEYDSVDNHPDSAAGSHSLFGGMRAGPDNVINTLTEELVVGAAVNSTLMDGESFEVAWPPAGWTEDPPGNEWNQEGFRAYDGTESADFDGISPGNDGNLVSPVYDCSSANRLYLEFWFNDRGCDPGEVLLEFYDGSGWNTISDMADIAPDDTWTRYQINISNVYFVNDFQMRWACIDVEDSEVFHVDLVTLTINSASQEYQLDLEMRLTDLPSRANEYLAVYGGVQGAEDLQVDYWNGASWVTLIADVQPGWNNVDISSYLTGSSFDMRFKDTVTSSDSNQDSWEIDAIFLNLFD